MSNGNCVVANLKNVCKWLEQIEYEAWLGGCSLALKSFRGHKAALSMSPDQEYLRSENIHQRGRINVHPVTSLTGLELTMQICCMHRTS